VPVLEQVVKFTQARHGVLAGNIANLNTPGYQTRDLSPAEFQEKLKEAVDARNESGLSPTYTMQASSGGIEGVSDSVKGILYHDGSNISMEKQVTEIAKNQLRAAITERA